MQLGLSASEAVTIEHSTVYLHADGRTETYDLAYMRMLIPYLAGHRRSYGMTLVHFLPGRKPWISLSTMDEYGEEPDLAGVVIYSGLGTHREMGMHLSAHQAQRLARVLAHPLVREEI